ncbi:MAG TPA: hypothetical protein VFQ77_22495 [Pseudonocardiaceae bacterium]|jgi:hypothetical protein|nr:hypothetical protein [Pseudonocardiaceae bacterium]
MRKFAPMALLLGMLSALLLGGVGVAQATAANYDCNQLVGVNVVSCNEVNVGDVKVEIKGNRVLTDNEITVLENNLNNTTVTVDAIKNTVIQTYKSFNPTITVTTGDIKVCIVAVCK